MSFATNVQNFPSSIFNKDPDSNLGKLYRIRAKQSDEIVTVISDLKKINTIKDQAGANLDRIGKLLNEPRGGYSDERYRLKLSIAIQKRISRGDINSVNSISSIILENSILLREEFKGVEQRFDGTRLFDGSWRFGATSAEPATIVMDFAGKPGELQINTDLVQAMNEIRAAGVRAKMDYSYEFHVNDLYFFTSNSFRFDGTWKFDGRKKFNGTKVVYDIYEIALGSGGLDNSGNPKSIIGNETKLINEKIRKRANSNYLGGTKEYSILLNFSELNNQAINEVAILTDDNLILAMGTFPTIIKQSGYQLNIKIKGAN